MPGPDEVQDGDAPARPGSEYAALKRLIVRRGLLEARPGYYAAISVVMATLLCATLLVLIFGKSLWLRVPAAVFLGFVSAQIAFVAHDIGHHQVLRHGRWNGIAGLIAGNLVLGLSRAWWIDKHNTHHAHPNEIDGDPDIDLPFFAFSEAQARAKQGIARTLVKHQAYLLFPLIFLIGAFSWRVYTIQTAFFRPRVPSAWAERVLFLGFLAWYLGLIFAFVGGWQAVLVIFLHHGFMGLCMGSVFAPNHKGMLVLDRAHRLDFLRQQVLTSRNVRPSPLADFLYGGLNYQIEHHLFPTMPRPSLREAQSVVRAFCAERGIGYHETGVRQSFREVLAYLHQVGEPLRAGARPAMIEGGS